MTALLRHLRLCLLLAAPLAAPSGGLAQEPLTVDHEASRINFVSKQMGVSVKGGFSEWEADIRLDADNPANSAAHIVVHTRSISTGHRDTDAEVKRKNWLAVEQFPTAEFRSESVRRIGEGRFEATGTLRIRDQTESLQVPFTIAPHEDGGRQLHGEFVIQRAAFEVGGGMWGDFDVVANDVRILFDLKVSP